MIDNFKVASIQIASSPNVDANLLQIKNYIDYASKEGVKLAVLPENFSMMAKEDADYLSIKEELGKGKIQSFLSKIAKENSMWIIGGTIPIESDKKNKVYSTCIAYDSDGKMVDYYHKIHLFDVDIPEKDEKYRESDIFTKGSKVKIIDTPFCKIGLAVCYDVRFPELFRKFSLEGACLVTLPSAFTAVTGKAHWEYLLKSRAIENLSYLVSSAQGGHHISGRETYGHSMIINPWGSELAKIDNGSGVIISDIDLNYLTSIRKNFPCLKHRSIK